MIRMRRVLYAACAAVICLTALLLCACSDTEESIPGSGTAEGSVVSVRDMLDLNNEGVVSGNWTAVEGTVVSMDMSEFEDYIASMFG